MACWTSGIVEELDDEDSTAEGVLPPLDGTGDSPGAVTATTAVAANRIPSNATAGRPR
jgi:hypothetical protein